MELPGAAFLGTVSFVIFLDVDHYSFLAPEILTRSHLMVHPKGTSAKNAFQRIT